ncbi:MAG: winged helix-turn-helix transcriptional regulator [Candidatus Aenigmarchaeota archaeon]|nr:winged helix-turn-helix transcriptional regulator [Candidatus Aenigmarchaeota archaeon]
MEIDRETIKALASESRLNILKNLSERRKMPAELQKSLGLSGSTIIEHLNILEKNSLVKRVETGHKWVYYELTEKGQSLIKPRFPTQFVIVLALGVVFAFGGAARFFSSLSSLSAPFAEKAKALEGVDVESTTTTLAKIVTTTSPAHEVNTQSGVVTAAGGPVNVTTTVIQTTTTTLQAAAEKAVENVTATTTKISSAINIAPDYLVPVLLGLSAVFLIAGVVGILKGRKTAIENIVVSL